ncbi:MAG: tail fiber domain-containing protein [Nonlabens sp.]|uniref:tail fiber domain-containing protein n=1 Tax=Nonlabens sp. TaxID=1888209 RepID=UPI003EF86B34
MKFIYTIIIFFFSGLTIAQVGINTMLPEAALDITSTDKGLLVPRMVSTDRLNIGTPATGLLVYQTDTPTGFYYYDGTAWISLSSNNWSIVGNSGTNPTVDKVGTTDNKDLRIVTSNQNAIRVKRQTGYVGIGTNNPDTYLHVVGANTTASEYFYEDFESGSNDTNLDNAVYDYSASDKNPKYSTLQNSSTGLNDRTAAAIKAGGNEVSFFETTINFSVDGTLTFDYYVQIATNSSFNFYIDPSTNPTAVFTSPTTSGWNTLTENITAGVHTFRWEQIRPTNNGGNGNTVFIDAINAQSPPSPVLTLEDGTQANGKILISDATGNASWAIPPTPNNDQDWIFENGNLETDPISRTGKVVIGVNSSTLPVPLHTLHVWNGNTSGSKMSFGSVEFIEDGISTLIISDDFSPLNDNSQNLGLSSNRWRDIYSLNGISSSDRNLKEQITNIPYGLNEVLELQPISYQWKNEKIGNFTIPDNKKETHLGFSAQQLQTVIPETVESEYWELEGEDAQDLLVRKQANYLGVRYTALIPVLTKAIQEQQAQIDQIENNNALIRAEIARLQQAQGN